MIFLTVTEPDHFEWKCKSIIVLWYVVFDVRSFLVNSWPSIRSTFLWFTWVAKWHTGHRPFVIIIIIVITIYYWISWEIRVPKNVRFLSCGMPGARSIDCGHSWNFFNGPFHAKIYNNNNNQFYQWFYIHFGRFFGGPDQWVPWLNAIQSIRKLWSTRNSLFKLSLSLSPSSISSMCCGRQSKSLECFFGFVRCAFDPYDSSDDAQRCVALNPEPTSQDNGGRRYFYDNPTGKSCISSEILKWSSYTWHTILWRNSESRRNTFRGKMLYREQRVDFRWPNECHWVRTQFAASQKEREEKNSLNFNQFIVEWVTTRWECWFWKVALAHVPHRRTAKMMCSWIASTVQWPVCAF